MKIWIDVDNPPQVQYLLPLRAAFASIGAETVITARDYGATVALLEQAGVSAEVFGARLGRSKLRKLSGLAERSRELVTFLRRSGTPDALLAASRASAVAARWLGIPSFIVGDYEYANVSVYRITGSFILHPDAIDPAIFRRRGLRADQLIAFRGLKEDLTFSATDVDAVEPHDFGPADADAVRVLFRPPSETSHYYRPESSSMALAALRRLGEQDVQVVFSPREPGQVAALDAVSWRRPPIVLERPVPFVALLKSVDAVVCSGGTMLREAAYLGIPAYSIFQSRIGGVDRRLEEMGRATLLETEADLVRLSPVRRGALAPLNGNPGLVDELAALIAARVGPPDPASRLARV